MFVSSLTLTNVCQFEQRTLEFKPGFNLLIGENGAGKTTVLRGLLAALGGNRRTGASIQLEDDDISLHAQIAEVSATIQMPNGDTPKFWYKKKLGTRARKSPSGKKRPLVLLYASNEATCSAFIRKNAKRFGAVGDLILRRDEEFLYELDRDIRSPRQSIVAVNHRFGNSQSVGDFVGKVLTSFSPGFGAFYWIFEPYDCRLVVAEDSDGVPLVDMKLQKRAKAFAMRFLLGMSADRRKYPVRWPDATKVTISPELGERSSLRDGLPYWKDIWNAFDAPAEERELLESCSLEVKLTPRIMIRRRNGLFRISQLSDGEQRLFSLFVDIARQLLVGRTDGDDGCNEAIILIDEIDVHLHPKWQRNIVPALEDLFAGCQFIATTHSPFVIQATDRHKITAVFPAGALNSLDGGNSIEDIAEDIQGVSVPQRSVRSERLSHAAERYFLLLKKRKTVNELDESVEFVAAKRQYREASEAFTSDPAVHALLKVQLMLGGEK